MSSPLRERLTVFREKAAAQGLSTDEVRRWAELPRPCARLVPGGAGPVVGEFGGPLLLPPDFPNPAHPYVAAIDLAALPAGITDLPLPTDGRLLLFVFPEEEGCYGDIGSAVYVPAGTPVAERDKDYSWYSTVEDYQEQIDGFPEGPLHATADLSLPHFCEEGYPADLRWEPGWPPHSEEVLELLRDVREAQTDWGSLQLGGFAAEEVVDLDAPLEGVVHEAGAAAAKGKVDFAVSEDTADWVLLADWQVDIDGWEGCSVHWAMQRQDLEDQRFDRVFVTKYWNP
ncbi:hypothetical protein [Lentzea sp. NPDC059081]|uniref:hypothetical protein n=1 Tax=Lentzea sp. NPDC059081 TaxID=3346719 RepID=UPI003699EF92